MAELKPLAFFSNHAGDGAVLADLLRSYGYLLEEEDGAWNFDATMGLGRDAKPCLRAFWQGDKSSLSMEWRQDSRTFSREEPVRPFAFEETPENRRRRVLRLAFHRLLEQEPLLQEVLEAPPNPWGILTGVRPTKMLQRFLDQGLSQEEIHLILSRDFGITEQRSSLLWQVGTAQRPFLPSLTGDRKKISLYLSYPFCPSRCSYCSFPGYDVKRWRKWQPACHEAMEREIRALGQAARDFGLQVETLYFGGGTPTAMAPADMGRILGALQEAFPLLPGLEWTVESGRPETLSYEMLEALASYPVNRICINPQTMSQATLDALGRKHEVKAIEEAFAKVRAFLPAADWRINSDLILGLPGEGLAEVEDSLRGVLELRPDNITLHGLAIKRGSAYKEGQETLPRRQLGLEMTDLSYRLLREGGYEPYYLYRQKDSLAGGENVGYTLPGRQCLYNILMIEERQTILGMGVGSGSKFLNPGDWSLENLYNPKDLIQYIERIEDLIRRKVDKLAQVG